MSNQAIQYRLLGPMGASRGDDAIDLGSPKQRALLAVLLLSGGRLVTVERIIDALWQHDPPASPVQSVQAYISNLRRALRGTQGEVSPIAWRSNGYVFDVAEQQLDVTAFAALVRTARAASEAEDWATTLDTCDQALALRRGRLFEDLADDGWARVEVDAAEELFDEAQDLRAMALLAAGRVAEAIGQAQQLVARSPMSARGCFLSMIALYRAGRASEALDAYREHVDRLADELGLDPERELRDLQGSILRHEPSLAAWPRKPGWNGAAPVAAIEHAPAPEIVPTAAAPVADDVLVGREEDTALLDRAVDEARPGTPRWIALTGPAGIGKTRLARHVADRTRTLDARTAWARCPDDAAGPPAWWVVRQVLGAIGEDADAVLAVADGASEDDARFAIYQRVRDVVSAAARAAGLLTVVVDDAQWLDAVSARCFAYLAGAVDDAPLVVALTLRDGESLGTIEPLMSALARAEGFRHLTVRPLDAAAVRDLADNVAAEPLDLAEHRLLSVRAGGNPLFVREYARLEAGERAGDAIPLAVRSVLGRRLQGLDESMLEVLRVAAVVGDAIDLRLVAASLDRDADDVADVLDRAADAGILAPAVGTGGYAFAHGLLRDEVVGQIPALRRQRMHARLATILDGDAGDPTARARHLLHALPSVDASEALAACLDAARADQRRLSFETAAAWWGGAVRAYALLPADQQTDQGRDDLIVARVEALALAGRRDALLDVIETELVDAVRQSRTSTVGLIAAALLRANGSCPWVLSDDDPAPQKLRLADLVPYVQSDPAAEARLLAATAVGRIYEIDASTRDAESRRAIEIAESTGDPEVLADALLGFALTYAGVATHAAESLEVLQRLWSIPHQHARYDETVGRALAMMASFNTGSVENAAEFLRLATVGADLNRLPAARVQLRWAKGQLAQWNGALSAADEHFSAASQAHIQTELFTVTPDDIHSHFVAWERGALAELADAGTVEPIAWQAAMASARGDHAAALEHLDAWLCTPRSVIWTTLGHATLLTHVAVDLGAADRVDQLVAYLEPSVDAIAIVGHGGGIGPVSLALARAYRLLGRTDEAAAMLDRAVDVARTGQGRITLLRCRLLAVQLGRFDGDPLAELSAIAAEAGALEARGVARAAADLGMHGSKLPQPAAS